MNSVTSCWMNLKLGLPPRCEMLSTEPVTKLSRPMTLWPRDKTRSVRCEPRKPAAPVMTEMGLGFFIDDTWFYCELFNCSFVRVMEKLQDSATVTPPRRKRL